MQICCSHRVNLSSKMNSDSLFSNTFVLKSQENNTCWGDSNNRDQTRVEKGNEDYIPGERKRTTWNNASRFGVHNRREATQGIHSGWKWFGDHPKDFIGGSSYRLHRSSNNPWRKESYDPYKQRDPSDLWRDCAEGRNAFTERTHPKRQLEDQIRH